MKIFVSHVESPPFHGLSVSQVKQLMTELPKEWIQDIKDIHLTDSLVPANSRWGNSNASYSPYTQRLTIFSRGRTATQLIEPILFALAANHLGLNFRTGRQLSKTDTQKAELIVKPLAKNLTIKIRAEQGAGANG